MRPDPARLDPREQRRLLAEAAAIARRLYQDADLITSVCHANRPAQLAGGAWPDRVCVIPNAAGGPASP